MIKIIDKNLIKESIEKAHHSPRKRMNFNFHSEYDDPINRMLNAMDPGTYVQPHKHENPDKREIFILLRGVFLVVFFDNNGSITQHVILDHKKEVYGVEIPGRVWHMVISLEPGSVVYEIKDGPYIQITDKNFAPWSPKENESECIQYMNSIIKKVGLTVS